MANKKRIAMERLRQYRQRNAETEAARQEYLNEQKLLQLRTGNFYEIEGPCKNTTDRRSEVA